MDRENNPPVVLTIAGFDPSGGAGLIVDVRTILSFGCQPVGAITSLTFQNAEAVFGAIHESAESLRAQLLPVMEENKIRAVKVGMIPTLEIAAELVSLLEAQQLPAPVIDPVLQSTSGYELMEPNAIELLKRELFPLTRLITPNIPEAETLTGIPIRNEPAMRAAARELCDMGAPAVLIKGGHLENPSEGGAIDLLDNHGEVTVFRDEWIDSRPVRGTGCMLSAGIAACLAQGLTLVESVRLAKSNVAEAIRFAQTIEPNAVSP